MLVWIKSWKVKGGCVLKTILKTSAYFACLAWSGIVCATGLGDINVSTYLGQPLKAEIELVSVDKADKSNITVKLASAESFKAAGIDYPYALPKLKFEVINRDSGDPYVKITSLQPVNEPFVTLLVEAVWPSGKLLREYTFLLDPADFNVQAGSETVKPIKPLAVAQSVPEVAEAPRAETPIPPVPVVQEVAQPTLDQRPVAEQPTAEKSPPTPGVSAPRRAAVPASASVAEKEAAPGVGEETDEITVGRGDTLSKIALRTKPDEVSLDRMLVALYRANAEAFVGRNMNRLQMGKIIRIPDAAELDAVQQSEAEKEVRAHVADWNVYRQQLASVRTEARDQAGGQESSGRVTSAVSEKASEGKEAAKGVVILSKGEAPGDATAAARKNSAQDKANAKAEEAIAKNKALKEEQERIAALEKNLKDLQRLKELKKRAAEQAASAAAVATSAVVPAKPKVIAPNVVQAPVAAVEPSLLDEVLQDPVRLAAVVVALLLLGGAGYVVVRRRMQGMGFAAKPKKEVSETEAAAVATNKIAAPVVSSPETGDFTHTTTTQTQPAAANNVDEVDPIGEADLFLTFGRDAQAEAVLKEALTTNPGNTPVKLKLLSIYSNRKDTNSFFTIAREIKDAGDSSAWNEACAMGRALEPDNPFYGGDGSSPGQIMESKSRMEDHSSVDFDLGFGSTTVLTDSAEDFMKTAVMDDASHENTTVVSADALRISRETPMDFDVTGSQSENKLAADVSTNPMFNMDEMMFDITSSRQSQNASAAASAQAAVHEEPSIDDLIFDVTTSNLGGAVAAAAAPAAAPATEENILFTLDFPTDFNTEPSTKTPPPMDIGLGEINLSLDDISPAPAVAASSGAKDERWQEVATKLDLAKAYQEMGDASGAKEILEEVLRDGDEQQRASAQSMLQQL